jgi:hypothetical protein
MGPPTKACQVLMRSLYCTGFEAILLKLLSELWSSLPIKKCKLKERIALLEAEGRLGERIKTLS